MEMEDARRLLNPQLSVTWRMGSGWVWRGKALEGEKGLMAPLRSGSGTELIGGNVMCTVMAEGKRRRVQVCV